jgi:hypothetical protein
MTAELVAVDPDTWRRLLTVASGLSRTVQASLDKLALLMTETGVVRSAVTKLRLITRRSKSTVSDHLGDAQEAGWLTCVSRGGHRADGATTSIYQASVPRQVWERREELLASLPVENPDEALVVVFQPGDIIAGHSAVEPTSVDVAGATSTPPPPSIPEVAAIAIAATARTTAPAVATTHLPMVIARSFRWSVAMQRP